MSQLCVCGCGDKSVMGKNFAQGHENPLFASAYRKAKEQKIQELKTKNAARTTLPLNFNRGAKNKDVGPAVPNPKGPGKVFTRGSK